MHLKDPLVFDPPLWKQRRSFASKVLLQNQIKKVLDLGCGEASLLSILLNDCQFDHLAGVDVSLESLQLAIQNCSPGDLDFEYLRELGISIDFYHGSLIHTDERLTMFDAITCIEVIEHLQPFELAKFPSVVFGYYQPSICIVSTPNAEFNVHFPALQYGTSNSLFRHDDHKFEWTRKEFEDWCMSIVDEFNYSVEFNGVGYCASCHDVGPCTQIAIFKRVKAKVDHAVRKANHATSQNHSELLLTKSIEFPFFNECIDDSEIISFIVEEMKTLWIRHWNRQQLDFTEHASTLLHEFKVSIQNLWESLKMRQFCKVQSKLIQLLKSNEMKQNLCMDDEEFISFYPDTIHQILNEMSKEQKNESNVDACIYQEWEARDSNSFQWPIETNPGWETNGGWT